jgi:hypothetical protein
MLAGLIGDLFRRRDRRAGSHLRVVEPNEWLKLP